MKLLFENWRGFLNEEIEEKEDLATKIISALKIEGGAAGMDGEKGLKKHTGATEEKIRAEIEKMDNVGFSEHGDAVLSGGEVVIKEEQELQKKGK